MKVPFDQLGYAIVPGFYSGSEVQETIQCIESAQKTSENFRKSNDLFAIRQFLKEIPVAASLIFNQKLKQFIAENFGPDYFVVKSIYFDKPEQSNWFVSWHQDLTISVNQKADTENYGPWTVKHNQFSVQPPQKILESIFTIRLHLDDTDERNGALRIVPGSHTGGVQKLTGIGFDESKIVSCRVPNGGIMLMRPLLFHSSGRTTNAKQRRVIHLELSNAELPSPLKWAEQLFI